MRAARQAAVNGRGGVEPVRGRGLGVSPPLFALVPILRLLVALASRGSEATTEERGCLFTRGQSRRPTLARPRPGRSSIREREKLFENNHHRSTLVPRSVPPGPGFSSGISKRSEPDDD